MRYYTNYRTRRAERMSGAIWSTPEEPAPVLMRSADEGPSMLSVFASPGLPLVLKGSVFPLTREVSLGQLNSSGISGGI